MKKQINQAAAPAGNDPRNWFFRAYDDKDNMMEQRVITDRTEDEARRECESYVEQPGNKWIEDWTLTPAGNDPEMKKWFKMR